MTALDAMRMALEALLKCREGFEYTRQYVGEDVLPPIDGWSWFEGDKAAKEAITSLHAAIAEMERAEPVAWVCQKCPGCGGPADNGHDHEFPHNPYYCTKCERAIKAIAGVVK